MLSDFSQVTLEFGTHRSLTSSNLEPCTASWTYRENTCRETVRSPPIQADLVISERTCSLVVLLLHLFWPTATASDRSLSILRRMSTNSGRDTATFAGRNVT